MFHDVSEKSVYELDPHPLKHKLRCSVRQFRVTPKDTYGRGVIPAASTRRSIELFTGSRYAPCTTVTGSGTKSQLLLSYSSPVDPHRPLSRTIDGWHGRGRSKNSSHPNPSIFTTGIGNSMGDTRHNHKESPHIVQELAEGTLINYSPRSLSIRAKLCIVSTREATEKVDITYALIGIFSSDLIPEYRDPGFPGASPAGNRSSTVASRSYFDLPRFPLHTPTHSRE